MSKSSQTPTYYDYINDEYNAIASTIRKIGKELETIDSKSIDSRIQLYDDIINKCTWLTNQSIRTINYINKYKDELGSNQEDALWIKNDLEKHDNVLDNFTNYCFDEQNKLFSIKNQESDSMLRSSKKINNLDLDIEAMMIMDIATASDLAYFSNKNNEHSNSKNNKTKTLNNQLDKNKKSSWYHSFLKK